MLVYTTLQCQKIAVFRFLCLKYTIKIQNIVSWVLRFHIIYFEMSSTPSQYFLANSCLLSLSLFLYTSLSLRYYIKTYLVVSTHFKTYACIADLYTTMYIIRGVCDDRQERKHFNLSKRFSDVKRFEPLHNIFNYEFY